MSRRISLPECAIAVIDRIGKRRGLRRHAVVLRALACLDACERAVDGGLCVGAADREKLERVIVGPGGKVE